MTGGIYRVARVEVADEGRRLDIRLLGGPSTWDRTIVATGQPESIQRAFDALEPKVGERVTAEWLAEQILGLQQTEGNDAL